MYRNADSGSWWSSSSSSPPGLPEVFTATLNIGRAVFSLSAPFARWLICCCSIDWSINMLFMNRWHYCWRGEILMWNERHSGGKKNGLLWTDGWMPLAWPSCDVPELPVHHRCFETILCKCKSSPAGRGGKNRPLTSDKGAHTLFVLCVASLLAEKHSPESARL